MTTISIVTPWLNHPELLPDYQAAVLDADEVLMVDTGSDLESRKILWTAKLGKRQRGVSVGGGPFSYAKSCNDGLIHATGDIVMFLNNDIRAVPGWLDAVRRDVKPGALYAVSTDIRLVDGLTIMYLEGWCIAALVDTWRTLGGWDAETFQRPYWEDVDLSWRATQLGIRLLRRPWLVTHLGNRTSATTPGAYDASDTNRRAFARKVAAKKTEIHVAPGTDIDELTRGLRNAMGRW